MTRTERLLAILQVLREMRMPVTAAVLAERFSVSERTIYRDIETLVSRGAVISGEAGIGYVLRDNFFLPPLAFDAQEAAAIMLGLRFVLRRGDALLSEAAASARAKLAAVAPHRFTEAQSLAVPLLVGPPSPPHSDTLQTVRQSLASERKLLLVYKDATGTQSSRIVWPVALGWFDDVEMLAAWCETRLAFRHFRVDRMALAEIVDERPPRARAHLLADYRAIEPHIVL
ncbi:MAG: YafY family transcriptional regulator [Methylobacterium mesophilicum]|nr:YafY family transcriptional regulator [Methylobacterium mesophilicum]